MNEHVVRFGPAMTLVGILSRPEDKAGSKAVPCIILLNGGLLPHLGPNDLYVHLAREMARSGCWVLRFDFWGQGDSEFFFSGRNSAHANASATSEAMDLMERMYGQTKFVLAGFCAGADVVLDVLKRDNRVSGSVLINPMFQVQSNRQSAAEFEKRILGRLYRQQMRSLRSWLRLFLGFSSWRKVMRHLVCRVLDARRSGFAVAEPTQMIQDMRGVPTHIIVSEGSKAWDVCHALLEPALKKWQELRNISIRKFFGTDHLFTPLAARQMLIDDICSWVIACMRS